MNLDEPDVKLIWVLVGIALVISGSGIEFGWRALPLTLGLLILAPFAFKNVP